MNSPTWITADGIPSYNLRYGHSKTLLFDGSSYLQTDKVYDIDYDVDWGFECTFTMLELPSSGNHYYLLGMDGDDRFAIRIDSSGNTKVLLGGDPQTSGDWTSFTTGFAAGTKYNLKVEFSKSDQEVSVQVDGGTATVTTPASNAYASGLVLFGKAEGAAGFEGIIHDIKWTYELTHQKKYTALFPVSKGYGTTLPDEKTSHVKEDLLFSGPQWLYLPSTTGGVVDALHGDTLTNGVGAFHNNAEAKLDFTGDQPDAPWLYNRAVPGDAQTNPYAFGDKRGIVEKATSNSIHLRDFSEYGIDVSRIPGSVDAAVAHAKLLVPVADIWTLVLDERVWTVANPVTFQFVTAISLQGFAAEVQQGFTAAADSNLLRWTGSENAVKFDLDTQSGTNGTKNSNKVDCAAAITNGLGPDDWIILENKSVALTGLKPHAHENFAAEIHQVSAVNSPTITLETDVDKYLFDTMVGGKLIRINTLSDFSVKGIKVTTAQTAAGIDFHDAMFFDYCTGVTIEDIEFDGAEGGLGLKRVADFTVKNVKVNAIKSKYAILLAGASYSTIEDVRCRDTWHAVSTGPMRTDNYVEEDAFGLDISFADDLDTETISTALEQVFSSTTPPHTLSGSATLVKVTEGTEWRITDGAQVYDLSANSYDITVKWTYLYGDRFGTPRDIELVKFDTVSNTIRWTTASIDTHSEGAKIELNKSCVRIGKDWQDLEEIQKVTPIVSKTSIQASDITALNNIATGIPQWITNEITLNNTSTGIVDTEGIAWRIDDSDYDSDPRVFKGYWIKYDSVNGKINVYNAKSQSVAAIQVRCRNFTITDTVVRGTGAETFNSTAHRGIDFQGEGCLADGCSVSEADYGIWVRAENITDDDGGTVTNCRFWRNFHDGIRFEKKSEATLNYLRANARGDQAFPYYGSAFHAMYLPVNIAASDECTVGGSAGNVNVFVADAMQHKSIASNQVNGSPTHDDQVISYNVFVGYGSSLGLYSHSADNDNTYPATYSSPSAVQV
ncbi:MAG: hypothetical protein R3E01_31795 [Pirellulaceae bacterium]